MAETGSVEASWLTPTTLFVLLNIVIGIIAVMSRQKKQQPPPAQPPLIRAPSLFSRVSSFNLPYFHRFNEPAEAGYAPEHPVEQNPAPQPLERSPSLISRFTSFNFSRQRSGQPESVPSFSGIAETLAPSGEVVSRHEGGDGGGPDAGEGRGEQHVARMNSEPMKLTEAVDPEAAEKIRKSASERGGRGTGLGSAGHDEEVDAKADDFINRFKQQLKLQRLDSLLRYRNANAAAGPR